MRAGLVLAGRHTSPLRAGSARLPSGAVGRFEDAPERMQNLAFARVGLPLVFGDGHALFQPADRVVSGRGQRLTQFMTNRAEFFWTDHKSASNRSHNSCSRRVAASRNAL
jgi:hypothetical protein